MPASLPASPVPELLPLELVVLAPLDVPPEVLREEDAALEDGLTLEPPLVLPATEVEVAVELAWVVEPELEPAVVPPVDPAPDEGLDAPLELAPPAPASPQPATRQPESSAERPQDREVSMVRSIRRG